MTETRTDGAHTLWQWLGDRSLLTPSRIAIESAAGTLSYQRLAERAAGLADRLLRAGLTGGDRVATLTANSADHVVLLFACARAGLVLAPLNWRLAPVELAYQLDDCEPALLLSDAGCRQIAVAAADAAGRRPPLGLLGAAGIETEAPVVAASRAAGPVADADPLLLMYTSGTTGRPKGALLSHANCFWTNLSLSRTAGMTSDDVVLAVLPQFHIGGWNVQPLLAWWSGATVVLPNRFDPAEALRLITRHRVTTMMGVPATYQLLSEHPDFADADLTSMRLAIVGGSPMPEALLRTWVARGVPLTQGYGLTEAAPNVLCLPPEDAVRRLGWAGKPYPHVRAGLVRPGSDELIDGAGDGELVVAGPNVFAGYLGRPDATAAAVRDGWLHTGDVAQRDDDGYYRLRGRLTDMYVSGGENVYPAEVESVLSTHPAVVEAAVIGVPDHQWGEVGYAVVVVRAGESVTENEVRDYCRGRIAGFKVPRTVKFVDTLPRSAVGKIDKHAVRAARDSGEDEG